MQSEPHLSGAAGRPCGRALGLSSSRSSCLELLIETETKVIITQINIQSQL